MASGVKHDGARIHRNRLARIRNVKSELLKELYASGEVIREDAKASIRSGAVSGPSHVPSAPGEPPNADTHQLDMSLDTIINQSGVSVSVVSRAPYSAFLEYGTSRIEARPFLRPALLRNRNRVVLGQTVAVNRVIRSYKSNPARSRADYEDFEG